MHFLVAETAKAMRDSGQANQKRQLADVAGRLRRGPAVILPPPVLVYMENPYTGSRP